MYTCYYSVMCTHWNAILWHSHSVSWHCQNLSSLNAVPDLNISTLLVVSTAEEFASGMVNVTCTPSDPSTVVFWRNSENLPLEEVYPVYQYLPVGLNHTVVLLSPPNGIAEITCGLYNGEGVMDLLNPINVTIVSISSKFNTVHDRTFTVYHIKPLKINLQTQIEFVCNSIITQQ